MPIIKLPKIGLRKILQEDKIILEKYTCKSTVYGLFKKYKLNSYIFIKIFSLKSKKKKYLIKLKKTKKNFILIIY